MTNITESLQKTIENIIKTMDEEAFPIQKKHLFRDKQNEKILFSILSLCDKILSKSMDSDLKNVILVQEDYELLKEYYQSQRNLIAVELQEILKVLCKKEQSLDKVENLAQILYRKTNWKNSYVSEIKKENRNSTKEEFDNPLYQSEFSAYKDWLDKQASSNLSLPITYSIQRDLSYDSYFHIACMELEETRVKNHNMTPERFAISHSLPEDDLLITEHTKKRYLKKLSFEQIQGEHNALKQSLIYCMNLRTLKGRESTNEIEEYWDAMKRLEKEQQRRTKNLPRYIKLR